MSLRRAIPMTLLATLPTLAACAPESKSVSVEWSVPLNNLGLLSIDPPQEDIRVGDVYLYTHNPDAVVAGGDIRQSWIGNRGRWTSLPVRDPLNTELSQRPSFPRTPRGDAEQGWKEAADAEGGAIFRQEETPRRLRHVQLQSITATFAGRDAVSVMIPMEVINVVAGMAWDDYKVMSVSPGDGEGYALSLDDVVDLLVESPGDGVTEYRLRAPFRRHLDLARSGDDQSVWMRVLSEVVYVRTLDISVQVANPPDMVEDVPPPDITAIRAPRKGRDPDAPDPAIQPYDRAVRINQLLEEMGAAESPGGSIRVVSVTDKSVTVRQTWPRALAVAARGLTIEIEPSTGRVIKIRPMGVVKGSGAES